MQIQYSLAIKDFTTKKYYRANEDEKLFAEILSKNIDFIKKY